jgi:hypothetical protein
MVSIWTYHAWVQLNNSCLVVFTVLAQSELVLERSVIILIVNVGAGGLSSTRSVKENNLRAKKRLIRFTR